MITPIEIRQHSFRKRTLGGYDIEEVQQFMSMISMEWEKMIEENRRLSIELEKTQAGFNSLKEVEGMLHKTLHQAEQSTKDTLENARKRATLIINEAESKAREVVRQGVEDRNNIDREIAELCERRDEILMQLQLFLKAQTDRLVGFSRKANAGNQRITLESILGDQKSQENLFVQPEGGKQEAEETNLDDIVEQL